MAQFELVKHKFPNKTLSPVYLLDFQITHSEANVRVSALFLGGTYCNLNFYRVQKQN